MLEESFIVVESNGLYVQSINIDKDNADYPVIYTDKITNALTFEWGEWAESSTLREMVKAIAIMSGGKTLIVDAGYVAETPNGEEYSLLTSDEAISLLVGDLLDLYYDGKIDEMDLLAMLGLTDDDVADILIDEGYRVDENTDVVALLVEWLEGEDYED